MDDVLAAKLASLRGQRISADDVVAVVNDLPWSPRWLLQLMATYRMARSAFTLDESSDESGLGVEMRWLTAPELVDEAKNAYPGIAAARSGYFPIGVCLLGTGDPYFIEAGAYDSAVYRIPHNAVDERDMVIIDRIERVSPSLTTFLTAANSE